MLIMRWCSKQSNSECGAEICHYSYRHTQCIQHICTPISTHLECSLCDGVANNRILSSHTMHTAHVHTFTLVCVSILISNSVSCPILPHLQPRNSGHSPSLARCMCMRMLSACLCACMHALLCPLPLQVQHIQTLPGCVRPLPYPKLCGLRGEPRAARPAPI